MRILFLAMLLIACTAPYPWKEIRPVVRYLDRDSINEVCRNLGLQEAVNGCAVNGVAYCPDEDSVNAYATCGREVRHVLNGAGSETPRSFKK
jgi:hypothetical protein